MSRSPRVEIEKGTFNELITLSGNTPSEIQRRHGWGHDYLANCVRQGWISQSRLSSLCKDIGVEERLMAKQGSPEQLTLFPDEKAEHSSKNERAPIAQAIKSKERRVGTAKFLIFDRDYESSENFDTNTKELIPAEWIEKAFVCMVGDWEWEVAVEVRDPFAFIGTTRKDTIRLYRNSGNPKSKALAEGELFRLMRELNGEGVN